MEKTVYEKWNNIVIENHSPEMGKKIIEWWESKVGNVVGTCSRYSGEIFNGSGRKYYFYGIIKGQFSNFSEETVKSANARTLQWSEVEAFEEMKEKKFKTGDPFPLLDSNEKWVFIAEINGRAFCVRELTYQKYKNNEPVFTAGLILDYPKLEENTLLSTDERLEILSYEPEKEWIPEYGERVLVWDNNEDAKCECYFHSKTNRLFWFFENDSDFLNEDYQNSFELSASKNCKPLPKEVWLTAEEISAGKGVGVDPKLIRFNINKQN